MAPTNLGAKDSPCKMNKWQTGLVPSRHKKAVMGVQDSLGSWLSLLKKRVCRFVAFFVVLGAFLHGDFWEHGCPHHPWLSDTLSRLTSGGAFSTRRLFDGRRRIISADRSRNTVENAVFSKAIVRPKPASASCW